MLLSVPPKMASKHRNQINMLCLYMITNIEDGSNMVENFRFVRFWYFFQRIFKTFLSTYGKVSHEDVLYTSAYFISVSFRFYISSIYINLNSQ